MSNNNEKLVVEMIAGTAPIPDDLLGMVQAYREYADVRGECVSFPRSVDHLMNGIFDALASSVK